MRSSYSRPRLILLIALVIGAELVPSGGRASGSYTYDTLGRLTSVIYDNGLCIAYSYDAAGNRTSISNATNSPAIWGSGTWGCFAWSP